MNTGEVFSVCEDRFFAALRTTLPVTLSEAKGID
jgi:hypothetical protein